MNILQKCFENQEENDCQMFGINTSVIIRIE